MMQRITLPFGRYAGRPLRDVPTAYLAWFLKKAFGIEDMPELRTAIAEILDGTDANDGHDLQQIIAECHAHLREKYASNAKSLAVLDDAYATLRQRLPAD
jgi:uncharacterized protein (DUF3820 family)